MMFVYPWLLWALSAILIPVIIHLFNFRRYKKVYFTNVRFLKELQLESQSKSRLKELLILLARIITILCLVLAFAQPVITDKNSPKVDLNKKTISIYIDNSFSMENVNSQGPILEAAKLTAKNIINSYRSIDRFQLITNDFEGKHQRLYSKEDALNELNSIKASPSVKLYSDVLQRQTEFNASTSNAVYYAVSDLQKSSFNIQDIKKDSLHKVTLIPVLSSNIGNVFIDTCWFESPVQQTGVLQKLHVVIQNNSNKTIEAGSVKLIINNNQAGLGSFAMDANTKKEIVIQFISKINGYNYASLQIDDYPITFDDKFYFTFNTKVNINTILINGKENETQQYFNNLFSGDSLFNLKEFSENSIDYSFFKNANTIILNELSQFSSGLTEELKKFSTKGGAIVIIPAYNANINDYNAFYKTFNLPGILRSDTHALKLETPDIKNPFFDGVFEKIDKQMNLPLCTQHFEFEQRTNASALSIFKLMNGQTYVSSSKVNNTLFYTFASSLGQRSGNFSKHALFVPTFIKIAVNSLQSDPLFYTLNNRSIILIDQEGALSEEPPHLKSKDAKIDLIPEIRPLNNQLQLTISQQLNEAGYYDILWKNSLKKSVSFNYNRIESLLNFHTLEELKNILQVNDLKNFSIIENDNSNDMTKAIQLGGTGIKLWKWFVLAALLFIAIEICLIRFLK